MSHAPSQWVHCKYKARKYMGRYRYAHGEREFILTALLRNGKTHTISFESHNAAKGLGWRKIK